MRLAKLALAGFKSFAKTTTFEFPAASSAIVGPNGSGKSNVAEAIRWVLGEQSLKTLRGKRGEDLIFSGTPSVPRLGRASVALAFDNRDRFLPLDFDVVTVERKIFRDGTNEYYLGGSPVRLKDIVELLARIGLGETKHNIIGQGEVDRVLAASPRERRALLEEAIGLRLFQLKKREAERKLEETGRNTAQVSALLQEIGPHIKFLKSQAEKAEKRDTVRRELQELYRAYVEKETAAMAEAAGRLAGEAMPAEAKLERLKREAASLGRDIEGAETSGSGARALRIRERELEDLEARRRELERELGRIEGRLEAASRERPAEGIRFAEVEGALRPVLHDLETASGLDMIDALKGRIRKAAADIGRLLSAWERGGGIPTAGGEDLTRARGRIEGELAALDAKLEEARRGITTGIQSVEAAQEKLRERFEKLRAREDEAGAVRTELERIRFEREKLDLRRDDLERMVAESGLERRDLVRGSAVPVPGTPEELKKKIERLRARLEEIGGIDEAVLKEYRDAQARHDFLTRELSDLAAAGKNLRELIVGLEERIERDFRDGFSRIKNEFHHYFRLIFGGGRGTLAYAPSRPSAAEAEGKAGAEGSAEDSGIEIEVDLPRKRIKGLAMLSGGERALVSVALLFAITAVNPPPFLVLDETDAALDEANSQKYGAILKELSKKTQLILITHNRETMKQAGILYGVTMGEDGVSKILSLKLEEAESYGNR